MARPDRSSSTKSNRPGSGGLTLGAFQRPIREPCYRTDSRRGTPRPVMWFGGEIGELATGLQDNAPGKTPPPTARQRANLEEEFADVLAWLMTLANINGVDMERALAKYTTPGKVEGVKH